MNRVRVFVLAALIVASLPSLAWGLSTDEAKSSNPPSNLDLVYRDPSDNLEYVDENGNNVDTGKQGFQVGGMGDFDGDGDLDVFYRDSSDNLDYVDSGGNNVDTGLQTFKVGGMGDFDGDGDLDIAYADTNDNLEYVDENGNNVDTGKQAIAVGAMGDFDGDGDLDIAYADTQSNLYYVDENGNNVDTGVDASIVGGMGDFDGDGDLDIAYTDTNDNLEYVDDNGNNVDTNVDPDTGIVGGMGDFDGDGDLDIAYKDSSGNLDYIDDSGNNVDTGVDVSFNIGGFGDFDGDSNQAPSVNVSTTPQQYGINDDVDVSVDASDSDGDVNKVCAEATRTNTTTTQTLNQSCRTTSSSTVTENFTGFFTVSDRGYNYTVNVNATDYKGATATDSKTRTIGNTAFTDAFDIFGDNVGAFNVTIDGQTKSRGDQFITGSSFNATFSKSGFFDKTATFTEGLDNEFTGIGNANVTVLVNDDPSGNTVNNYTATISNNSNGFSESKNTTTGSVSFFAVQNATYNVTSDSDTRPFTSRIVNVTSKQQNVTFTLKKERTAELTFKDTTGNSLITEQVNYTLTPTNINASVVSGDTSTGSANETLLEPASYRGQAESNGFEPNTFFFTIRDESINDKTVYLTGENKTSPITVTVLDQATNPVSGVKVRLQRFYTNTSSYNTITASQTDSEGQTTLFPPADRAYYKFTFNRDKDLLKITDPLQLLKATYQFTVSLGETQLTESNAYTALSTDLRYDNATSDFKATIDQSGENNKACLITERTGALRTTRLNKTCTTSTTATLILPRGQANDTYTAIVTYQTQKSTFEVDTLTKSFGDETPATTTGLLGQLVLTLVAGVPAVALLPSLSPVIIASTIALGWWIGLTTIGIGAVMAILVTGVTATIAARKR